ncbi:IS607 family transposase [Streptomonospora salina]|uniref:Putative resolvase n=1 Tax=Streptomonospora salina TaxID=104205 RepID=A0A841E3S4_9ACTN|nr:IS607 family transposase [Streptomonospora salina]MBB5997362.1 putative resolvase [Streptomonospora salina]
MKLTEWARTQGVSYRSALNWFHAGTLPVPARQLATGTILVEEPVATGGRTAAYCRVSSTDRKPDLERQAGRVAAECGRRGITLDATVTETGSALDGNRPKLHALLRDASVATIVVEHRDRLARFGTEHVESALAASGRSLVVLDDAEVEDDLVGDMTQVLTSMCARLYGRRSARRRAQAAVDAARTGTESPA